MCVVFLCFLGAFLNGSSMSCVLFVFLKQSGLSMFNGLNVFFSFFCCLVL